MFLFGLMGDGSLYDRYRNKIFLGFLDALIDGEGNFLCFSVSPADLAFSVSDADESTEGEPFTTLDYFAATVDLYNNFFKPV
jgi:hypothetical protein